VRIPIAFSTPPQSDRQIRITYVAQPIFVKAPTSAEVVAAHPRRASDIEGRALLDCIGDEEGALGWCSTVWELPKGRGFGAAAKSLAHRFRVPARLPDGASAKGVHYRVPVHFSAALATGRQVAQPQWERTPDAARIAAALGPVVGATRVAEARAVLDCEVAADGALTGCRVAEETPAGLGVGAAALSLADAFRARPWSGDGRPVDGARVSVPIVSGGAAAAPAAR
jgi:hypothetical protein